MDEKAERAVRTISGILLVLSGVITLLGIRMLPPLEAKDFIALALVLAGVSMILKASPGAALLLAFSSLVLLLSLSGGLEFRPARLASNATFQGCRDLTLNAAMSSLKIEPGASNEISVKGYLSKDRCSFSVCCARASLRFKEVNSLRLELSMSNLKASLNRCLKSLKVDSYMSSAHILYDVPEGCNSTITLNDELGSVYLKLIVPNDVKVVYNLKGNAGGATLSAPNGLPHGNKGTIVVSGISNMGTLKVLVERK